VLDVGAHSAGQYSLGFQWQTSDGGAQLHRGDRPHYIAKAEKKGRTKAEVDQIIRWLTGYIEKQLDAILEKRTSIETFISKAKILRKRRACSLLARQEQGGHGHTLRTA